MNKIKNWVSENKFNIIASIVYFGFIAIVCFLVEYFNL